MIARRSFLAVIIAAALLCGPVAFGADPEAPAPKPLGPKVPASAALKQIPAGCMGFVVINNVNGLSAKADAFLKAIAPAGPAMAGGSVLDKLGEELELGEGFNPNGPLAAFILDPQQYGVDLLEMMDFPGAKPRPAGEKPPELPAVVLIPGKDPAKVLAAGGGEKAGEYVKIGGKYWKQVGNFVAGSRNKKALAAVVAVKKSVLTQLSPADKALIARNDAAGWVNFKVVGPIAQAALKQLEKAAAEEAAAPTAGMAPVFAVYRAMLKDLEDVAFGVRFAKTGILMESRVSFLPEGTIGKAMAAMKVQAGPLLDRLPKTPYVLAFGCRGTGVPRELNLQMFDKFVAAGILKEVPAKKKARWRKMASDLESQVTGIQLSVGAITGGEGQLGMVYVLQCKSADKVKALLPEYVGMISEMYKATKDEMLSKLQIKYHKGLEAIGTKKVDSITIDHPEIVKMDESDRAKFRAILGEDKFRLMVVQADAKTVVMTLGGGTKFLETAMKTASARSGKLAADPGIASALSMLPKKRMAVGLMNLGNIFTVVKRVSAAVGEPLPAEIKIVTPTPLVGSMSIERSDLLFAGYIPSEAIRNVVAGVMELLMGAAAGGAMPVPPPPPGF